MQTTLIRVLSAGFALTLFAVGSGVHAQKHSVPVLSVDMPQGGCSLTVRKDGKALIHYGAMPKWVRVIPGTFDFDQLVLLLRTKSYPQGDRSLHGESVGTVSLPESEHLRLIDEAALVRSLLERAWKARVAPTRQSEDEDYRWVAKACSFS